jgi:Na+/H+ antiporter NhaD/arsenite permease-like protein
MHGDDAISTRLFWHGPRMWAISAAVGAVIGVILGLALPPGVNDAGKAVIPAWTIAPFVLLLLSIAVAPLVSERWWHRHYPDVSFVLGALVAAYYATALTAPTAGALTYGTDKILHAAIEYYGFIALVGGLYLASGGILVGLEGRAGPASNTILLCVGAVLANLVGTTGASVLLIRPFMKSNDGRLRPLHVVFFIIIVSNCGGVLTPIGDPPLYLGYLKGVPFFWVPMAMWSSWLIVVLPLLAIFFVYDMGVLRRDRATSAALAAALEPAAVLPSITLGGRPVSFVLMGLIVAAVFIDPALQRIWHVHLPVGPTVQIVLALVALRVARRDIMEANEFSWEAVKEVGLLFAGIFLTMMPALAYLSANGKALGLTSPSAFYWATGALSAVLDNAPTYLNFVQLAVTPAEVDRASIAELLSTPAGQRTLEAISAGAVFFGALTYIGNGPNFMVRSIAIRAGVEMPSFFGYAARAMLILGPVLVLHWAVRVW